jgi:hypothetical protein
LKRRTIFYGKKAVHTPKKDGDNPWVPDRRGEPLETEDIKMRFSNNTVTQFGGYLVWHEFCQKIGIKQRLARHVRMERGSLAFTAPELGKFLLDAKVLRAERLMHLDTLRLDPLVCGLSGIQDLPSGKTMGVFLKEHEDRHLAGLDRMTVTLNNELWEMVRRTVSKTRQARMEKVILDYDSSTFAVYGKQEGADRGRSFRKKDKPGFQPRFAFLAGLGIALHQELLPQSHNLNRNFLDFHREAVARLPKTATVWAVRADGAVYSEKHIESFEKDGLVYAVSAAVNAPLRAAIEEISENDWEERRDEDGHSYSIARIRYTPKTWKDKPRTFVISRRLRPNPTGQRYIFDFDRYKHFAYVTNYRRPLYEQFKFAVERCSLESFIKESKNEFNYDFLPCKEFHANRAYVGYTTLARNLSIFFRLLVSPPTVNRWSCKTFQQRLLRVPGNLWRQNGQWNLSLQVDWPYKTVLEEIRERCRALPSLVS